MQFPKDDKNNRIDLGIGSVPNYETRVGHFLKLMDETVLSLCFGKCRFNRCR